MIISVILVMEILMSDNILDLKNLVIMINQEKEKASNLCLDEGCQIQVGDPKPLVKVINYIINYLQQITEAPLEIGLDLREEDYLLTIMAYSTTEKLPPISARLAEVLLDYRASYEVIHQAGTNVQLKIKFKKSD